jgi:flagellar assembly protein FliH
MSTDAFSRVQFPRLDGRDRADDVDAYDRARLRGYADGHAEGFRAAAAEVAEAQRVAEEERLVREAASARALDAAVAALHAASRSLSAREHELTAAGEAKILGYAIELAELIVAGELTEVGTSAAVALRRALTAADITEIRALRVHPDDLAILERSADLPSFSLIPDETLDRGDAVAVLAPGHIDARIGTALERARAAVADGAS